MFKITFFPAQQGDAIWIEYGASANDPSRILIDAGTPATAVALRARIESLPADKRRFDLMVITHVDTDHIGGVLKLLSNLPARTSFDDIWFNGWPQIRTARSSKLGPIDGEILGVALQKLGLPWNKMFDSRAVAIPLKGALPEKTLRGGMKLTVLSPGGNQLSKLRENWKKIIDEAGLNPKKKDYWDKLLAAAARKGVKGSLLGKPNIEVLAGSKFKSDTAPANGSSIGLLAEFDEKAVLLSADAYAGVLLEALGRLNKSRGVSRQKLDLFKLPHHGSSGNINNELLSLAPADAYVFSTSGAVFAHPDDEAVARVIATKSLSQRTLHFNYTLKTIEDNYKKKRKCDPPEWNDGPLKRKYRYDLMYPANDSDGTFIEL